jgi:hypothetical protein
MNHLQVVSAKASFFCLIFSFNDSASLRAAAILSAMSELLSMGRIQAEMRGTGRVERRGRG